MGSGGQDGALEVVQATSVPIHDIGTAIYLSQDVFAWAAEWGWPNPFAFYFAGRGGMLGDVSAEVVVSAFGWFQPDAARLMYDEGASVGGASAAAARMAEAHGRWGEEHYGGVKGIDEIVSVTEDLVDGLEGSGIPLFVGWRRPARAGSPAGRARPADADVARVARRAPPGRHHVRGPLAARGDPDQ